MADIQRCETSYLQPFSQHHCCACAGAHQRSYRGKGDHACCNADSYAISNSFSLADSVYQPHADPDADAHCDAVSYRYTVDVSDGNSFA